MANKVVCPNTNASAYSAGAWGKFRTGGQPCRSRPAASPVAAQLTRRDCTKRATCLRRYGQAGARLPCRRNPTHAASSRQCPGKNAGKPPTIASAPKHLVDSCRRHRPPRLARVREEIKAVAGEFAKLPEKHDGLLAQRDDVVTALLHAGGRDAPLGCL